MALVKIVGGFLGLWVIFYLVVYLTYMSPDDSKVSKASEKIDENGVRERNLKLNVLDTPFAHHPDVDQDSPNREQIYDGSEGEYHDFFEPAVGTNPFLTDTCTFRTQQAREILSTHFETAKNNVGIVIPARNENKNELLKTVESIIKNSGSELKKIIVVDDFSTAAIESWPEWRSYYAAADTRFGGSNGNVLQISRLHHRNGVAKAKAFGAEQLRMAEIDVLVFLDAHVIVSKDWLIPLTTELHKHPKSLVYPAIDIIDGSNGDLIKGENAVGAFDWSMDFRWEILVPTKLSRMKARVPISAIDKDGHPINGKYVHRSVSSEKDDLRLSLLDDPELSSMYRGLLGFLHFLPTYNFPTFSISFFPRRGRCCKLTCSTWNVCN